MKNLPGTTALPFSSIFKDLSEITISIDKSTFEELYIIILGIILLPILILTAIYLFLKKMHSRLLSIRTDWFLRMQLTKNIQVDI